MSDIVVSDTESGRASPASPHTDGREYYAFPASFAQRRLWFLDKLQPGDPSYNIPAAYQLLGPLDVGALHRAIARVIDRHEVLRTKLAEEDGELMQLVSPHLELRLSIVSVSALRGAARAREVERLVREEAARPFDLAAGPLLRATLVRVAREAHVLLLTLHHSISDGWSQGVLLRELQVFYDSELRRTRPILRELPLQYADFAIWQREYVSGPVLDEQLRYWTTQLGGAPPVLDLPTDYPRRPVQRHRGARRVFRLPRERLDALQALARREGATLHMVLLAAWSVLLGRYAGQEQVVVGTPIAGRTRPDLEELIGLFVNTLALRADLSGDPTFRELLARVRETTLGAYAHQDLPFEKLVEALAPSRSLSHTPLFQVELVVQNMPRVAVRLGRLAIRGVEQPVRSTKYDLSLFAHERPDGLALVLRYATDLFAPHTIARMLRHFATLLEAVIADPDQRVSALPLMPAIERQRVLHHWTATAVPVRGPQVLHALVERQAARTPDALAVVGDEGALTYAALDAQANQWARVLRQHGVGR
jgi:hypothetical protein